MRRLLQSTRAYALLKAERAENRLSHAYLLVFDDARNLQTAVTEFAKLFFLPSRENAGAEEDGYKRVCALIDEKNFADCIFLPAPGGKFSVEDAERIREESALKPVESDCRLFVVADFADATVQAQNKLLKLLEDPPAGVRFLLGATVTFPVLPTVLSRTEKLEIPPFSTEEVAACLRRLYPDKNTEGYAEASAGSVGSAQNILEGGYYESLLSSAFELAGTDPFRLPSAVRRAGETPYKKELISLLRLIFRDALIVKTSGFTSRSSKSADRYLLLKTKKSAVRAVADRFTLRALLYAQEALSEAEKQIRFNAVYPQCLELCLAKILEKNK